jgi:hypothetical protein
MGGGGERFVAWRLAACAARRARTYSLASRCDSARPIAASAAYRSGELEGVRPAVVAAAMAWRASLNSCTGGPLGQPVRHRTPMTTAKNRNISELTLATARRAVKQRPLDNNPGDANNPLRRRCTRQRAMRFPTRLTDARNPGLVLFAPRQHRRAGPASVPGRRDCDGRASAAAHRRPIGATGRRIRGSR